VQTPPETTIDTTMRREVRRPLYAGSQMVRALWFDIVLLGEAQARERLLAWWQSGARAYRLHSELYEGYLLEWPQARRLVCERLPGLALCEQDGVLASAPLLAHERAGSATGSALLVLGASVHASVLTPELRIDPSLWIELDQVPLCAALVMPRQPSAGFVAVAPAPAPDARAVLGDAVPPPSAQQAAFLHRAMQARRERQLRLQGGSGGEGLHAAVRALGIVALAAAALSGSVAAVVLLPRLLLSRGDAGSSGRPAPARPTRVRPPAREGGRLAAALARLSMLTRLSKVLGWRQANYLRKMVRRFEQGDVDEALRHAIPLDGAAETSRPAFGVPGRRASLDITGPAGSASAIGLDTGAIEYLRATYQRTHEMLDRAGRIDEAAFVLAELLNRRKEAVDYLERKGRIAQAAQLAETLELTPDVQVRLHCMAGNLGRAVQLARLTDSFDAAVGELERRQHPDAGTLRFEWALALAARGRLAEAARVVWPLQDRRDHALAWLRAAEQAGGTIGVQGLLLQLVLDPHARQAQRQSVHDLLFAAGEAAARRRVRACEVLLELDVHDDFTHRLAGELWRRLLLDRGAGLNALPAEHLKHLRALAADPALDADAPAKGLPGPPGGAMLATRATPLTLSFDERGVLALHDVRRLPDGGYLLALGENGVALTREDGSEALRFPLPADRLVLADGGRQALALARREKAVRVSRIDLLACKAGDWFSAQLDLWADGYDGANWSVVAEGRLMVLDTVAAGQSVVWQVRALPGRIVGLARDDGVEAMLVDTCGAVEQWRYGLPARRLMSRDAIEVPDNAWAVLPNCANPVALVLRMREHDAAARTVTLALPSTSRGTGGSLALCWVDAPPRITLHDGLLLIGCHTIDGWHCRLVDMNARVLADIHLPEADGAQAALHDGHLLVWDRRGRLVDIDLATSASRMLTFG